MRRLRISLAGLMLFIVAFALGIAALRYASPPWAALISQATILGMGFSALLAVYRRGPTRAFWLGFTIVGGIFCFDNQNELTSEDWPLPWKFTSLLLERCRPILHPREISNYGDTFLDDLFADPDEQAIRRMLNREIPLPFATETPLSEVIVHIRKETSGDPTFPEGLPVYIDPDGLLEAEKTLDSPITFDTPGIPLKRSLRLMLKQLDMTYKVDEGVVKFTYLASDDSDPPMRAYERIGHSLFALFFATVGGLAGVVLFATKRDDDPGERRIGERRA